MMNRMKRSILRSLVPGMLLFGAPALFGATTVNMTLTGVGSNGVLGGVYIGPYVASIDGVTTPVICDDFISDTYLGESWQATAYDFSEYAMAKFGGLSNAAQLYNEAAWLATQLVSGPIAGCPNAGNCAGAVQYALWQVFAAPAPLSALSGTDLANANYWLGQAQSQAYTPGQFSNVTIYTYASHATGCPGGSCSGAPQEFLVVRTPEPESLALLGFDLSGVGALLYAFRRRRKAAQPVA